MESNIKTVWIDLDNTPHVPLFRPIIEEFNKRNIKTIITARDYAQTAELLKLHSIPHIIIGKHGGKNKLKKIFNLVIRSCQLWNYIKNLKIDLAVSHGSRTQLVAAKIAGIKTILMMDYEYTESNIFNLLASHIFIPAIIPEERIVDAGLNIKKIHRYNGFKEELYLKNFIPDLSLRASLDIPDNKILVSIRPPAMLGNYHDPLSEKILISLLNGIVNDDNIVPLIVSRTAEDRNFIINKISGKILFLDKPVDGLQLIWNSDLIISGGGTMNREAALLGVPVYSIFTGRKPYIDEHFEKENRLFFIDSIEKTNNILFIKRTILKDYIPFPKNIAAEVVDAFISL